MNTPEEERISSRHLPGPERKQVKRQHSSPYSTLPLRSRRWGREAEVQGGETDRKSATQTYCWRVSTGSRPELGEGRSYEDYLGLDILIMEEGLYWLL